LEKLAVFSSDCDRTNALLDSVAAGNSVALQQLLQIHRPYLKKVVQSRLSPVLAARVDASDIIQETQIEIAKRIGDFISRRPTTFRIWIRRKALEKLVDQQRRHVTAKRRSVLSERHISDVSSLAIARNLLASSPSRRLRRVELRQQVRELIERLSGQHREVLLLRHVEGLSNAEVADLLGTSPNTIRQRYGRALRQLHKMLAEHDITLGRDKGA
jgi:RNA polymerase sigma-70 factor (ECF subfamily)